MQATLNAPTINGTPNNRIQKVTDKKSKKAKAPTRLAKTTADRIKFWATIVMGVFMPLLSLGLSFTGGNLLGNSHLVLSCLSFVMMACVLSVSLAHLAWSIGDITRSPAWASWLLAVAFDSCLVLGELCHIQAEEAGVGTVCTTMMVAVCGLSMFLNCWAFLRHR
jgi:hypothetical protein